MRLLLDTHAWIWSLLEPDRLKPRIAKALEDPENEIWLSPISIRELMVLAKKKRITLDSPVEDRVAEALEAAPLREAPITHEIATETGRIELGHPDPADRFLLATAKVLDLTLVTANQRLIGSRHAAILANR